VLSQSELNLLDKGLTFIPTVKYLDLSKYQDYVESFIRRLKLFDFFADDRSSFDPKDFSNMFISRSHWTPPNFLCSRSVLQTIKEIEAISEDIIRRNTSHSADKLLLKTENNLSNLEYQALLSLKNDDNIIIKAADKGGSLVVMDRDLYIKEAHRQLDNSIYYKRISQSTLQDNCNHINIIVQSLFDKKYISAKQMKFLQCQATGFKPRKFYLLPKVHKDISSWPNRRMPPGRPIVSCCGTELHSIGRFVDFYLQPLTTLSDFYIKDTYHFISKIRGQPVGSGCYFVTGDITSLYTNMDHSIILSTIKEFFNKYPDNNRPDEELIELMKITLFGNDFSFNYDLYLQVLGMAMGNPCAPSTANLFLDKLDKAANSYLIAVMFFHRFLDDVFFVWPGTLDQLSLFEKYLNSIIPNIHITFNSSLISVNFLDITIFKHNNNGVHTIETKPFFKDTDTHQLVHTTSFHPHHTFKGIIRSQFIRLKRLSSFKENYVEAANILKPILMSRGYSRRLLRSTQNDIWHNFIEKTVTTNTNRILPVVLKYDPIGLKVSREFRRVLNGNGQFLDVRIITAFSTHRNLGSHLINSSALESGPNPTRTTNPNLRGDSVGEGCIKCTSTRCKACNFISESSSFRSSNTNKLFFVKGRILCKSVNLVYLISCKRCRLQYVGETGRMLSQRTTDHLSCIRLHKNTPIATHFNSSNHTIMDFSIIGIELSEQTESATSRRKREQFWQTILNTKHPNGINCLNQYT